MFNPSMNPGLFSRGVAAESGVIAAALAAGIKHLPAGTYVMNRSAAKAFKRSMDRQAAERWTGKCDTSGFKARLAILAANRVAETDAYFASLPAAPSGDIIVTDEAHLIGATAYAGGKIADAVYVAAVDAAAKAREARNAAARAHYAAKKVAA